MHTHIHIRLKWRIVSSLRNYFSFIPHNYIEIKHKGYIYGFIPIQQLVFTKFGRLPYAEIVIAPTYPCIA